MNAQQIFHLYMREVETLLPAECQKHGMPAISLAEGSLTRIFFEVGAEAFAKVLAQALHELREEN
jgi:hypothetical protein